MATATATKPLVAPEKETESEYVLVHYNPSKRPLGEYTLAQFIAYVPAEGAADSERLAIRPGVRKIERSEWEKWQSLTAPAVKNAIAYGVLYLISEEVDLLKLDKTNPLLAQDVLQHTNDMTLLSQWAEHYAEFSPVLCEAMDLKNDAMKAGPLAAKKFVFGKQVA
jgi:hypothetical protein